MRLRAYKYRAIAGKNQTYIKGSNSEPRLHYPHYKNRYPRERNNPKLDSNKKRGVELLLTWLLLLLIRMELLGNKLS